MDGKIGVNSGQAGKEMTFLSVDSFLGRVSAMDVGRRKLVRKRDELHAAFEAVGAFVVLDLWNGFEAVIGEVLAELCKGLSELTFTVGLNGFCKDRVRIVVVENHDALGAVAEGVRETTVLVAENSARNRHRFGKHNMGLEVGIGRDGQCCHDVSWWDGG